MEFTVNNAGSNNVNSGVNVGSNVPAFLTKLWTLVEDPHTDHLICWSPNGTSFHVFDQGQFSKEVLPKFFKHNNMASFVRQLNMYGFRKVVHIEQGGLVKPERDDTEFQHPYFIRGQEHLLENIKRKVTNVSSVKQEEMRMTPEDVTKILTDVQHMKGKQENIDAKIITMKHENEALWREVASLRQKHAQQQKVVSKLIQFLVSLVQSNRVMGMKRKIPLMLSDSSSTHSLPKYSRQFSLEHVQSSPAFSTSSLLPSDSPLKSGPIISDITDLAPPSPTPIPSDWTEAGASPLVHVKEEVEEGRATPVDSSLSPTTFINSILQDDPAHNLLTANPLPDLGTATGSVVTSDRAPSPAPAPNPASSPAPSPAPCPAKRNQKCLSVSCIDNVLAHRKSSPAGHNQSKPISELSEHLETIDGSLESLQTILNSQNISFDSTPLFDFFSSSVSSGDFDLDSLDSLLSPLTPKADDNTGKQLVQYMATPLVTSEPLGSEEADLPSLLELEGEESYFNPDPNLSLLATPIFSQESNEQEEAHAD